MTSPAPLWDNDKIVQVATDVCRMTDRGEWQRTANIVDALREMRGDYEAVLLAAAQREQALRAQVADLTASLAKLQAAIAALPGVRDEINNELDRILQRRAEGQG